jgi:hypothetical protein
MSKKWMPKCCGVDRRERSGPKNLPRDDLQRAGCSMTLVVPVDRRDAMADPRDRSLLNFCFEVKLLLIEFVSVLWLLI